MQGMVQESSSWEPRVLFMLIGGASKSSQIGTEK